MLIAMAGLPGTGKSTLAARLAETLGGVVVCKDVVRAALFPPVVLDYSAAQDNVAMSAVYAAARLLLTTNPARVVIIDGRTFRKSAQLANLFALGSAVGQEPVVIECACDDAVARERLARDAVAGTHLAGNRNADLYATVKATAEPLTIPRLVLDTGRLSLDECLVRMRDYLASRSRPDSSVG